MRFSQNTLIRLRQAALALVAAIEAALLEGYGWTPRGHSKQAIDNRDRLDA
jgi:hypothetical protein